LREILINCSPFHLAGPYGFRYRDILFSIVPGEKHNDIYNDIYLCIRYYGRSILSVRERLFLPLTQFGRACLFPMNVPLLLSRVRLAHPHPRRSSHLTYLVPRSPDGQFFRLVPCPRTSPYSTYLPGENERFGPYLQRSFQAGGKVGPALLTITKVCLSFMVEVLLYGRACPTPSNRAILRQNIQTLHSSLAFTYEHVKPTPINIGGR